METGWSIKKAGYRVYQKAEKLAVGLLKFPEQQIIKGENTLTDAVGILEKLEFKSVLVVCSRSVHKHGLLDGLLTGLQEKDIRYIIFEDIHQNPTVDDVETGCALYKQNRCEAIIVIGGGSPMDCAKVIGLRVNDPKLSYGDMQHILKIKKKMPYMIAVPTTAGTGSESTVAAVISNPDKKEKYAVTSPLLMPACVILDPVLTVGLPADFTAYTGIDALTHAVEAYIGLDGTAETDKAALEAIRLIFMYLDRAYSNPTDMEAREEMLEASNLAGYAFTRAFVGYVHAFSHALSALYNIGHGKTNAVILPKMLEWYGESVYLKLASIARYIGMDGEDDEDDETLAKVLISEIKKMNERCGVPDYIEELVSRDAKLVAAKALHEANPGYPVPKYMDTAEAVTFAKSLLRGK